MWVGRASPSVCPRVARALACAPDALVILCPRVLGLRADITSILLTFLHVGATAPSIAYLPFSYFSQGIASPLAKLNADMDSGIRNFVSRGSDLLLHWLDELANCYWLLNSSDSSLLYTVKTLLMTLKFLLFLTF